MGKQSKKSFILKIVLILVALFALIVLATFFISRISFRKQTEKTLSMSTQVKELEAEAQLGSELVLVKQLARSPEIIKYLSNPNDEQVASTAVSTFKWFKDTFLSKEVFWISDVDHKFYSDMEYSYTLDPNDSAQYWYNMTLNDKEDYNFNINYNPDLNITMLWVNAVVRNENGVGVGVTGTGIPLTDFVSGIYKGLDDKITMYLYTDGLKIVGAKDQSILEKELNIKDHFMAMKKVQNITPQSQTSAFVDNWQIVIQPINLFRLYIVMAVPAVPKTILPYTTTPFAIFLAVILVAFIIIILAVFMRYLSTLKGAVGNLSSGNADLTSRIDDDMKFKGLIQLAQSLNIFIEKLQGIVTQINASRDDLYSYGEQLASMVKQNATFVDEMVGNIENVNKEVENQNSSVGTTVTSVQGISGDVQSLNTILGTQKTSMEGAASAVTQMIGNIDSVSRSVDKMANEYSVLYSDVENGINCQQDVNEQIKKIEQQSKMLNDANAIISSIAEQTNLLAMNAAIEAAHAGDAGKGFAVVADEIRKLSENSANQSRNIGQQINSILELISGVVVSSNTSDKAFENVNAKVKGTGMLVQQIMQAMKEQLEGSKQISNALSYMNDTTGQVQTAANSVDKTRGVIIGDVEGLKESSNVVLNEINNMGGGVKQIEQADNSLMKIATSITESISRINEQINQFKV